MYIDLKGLDLCRNGSPFHLHSPNRYGDPNQTRLPHRCAYPGWLRGPKTRIGPWISGITCLLLAITSMRTSTRMKIDTMAGTTTIMKTGQERTGKGLRPDSLH